MLVALIVIKPIPMSNVFYNHSIALDAELHSIVSGSQAKMAGEIA